MGQPQVIDYPYQPNVEQLFARIRQLPDAVWLDSGKPYSLYGRFDLISAAPDAVLETRGGITTVTTLTGTHREDGDPFTLAEQLTEGFNDPGDSLFNGGLIGFWGYGLGRAVAALPVADNTALNVADMRLGRYLWALLIDHAARQARLVFHGTCPEALRRDVRGLLAKPPPAAGEFQLDSPFQHSQSYAEYLAALAKIHDYITAGDCYQVNYAQHFSAPFHGDTWPAYCALRRTLPSPFSAFMACGEESALLSLSPERFIKCSQGQAESKPIKGTIKRGATLEEDHQNAVTLQNSVKDRAENLMIVDLLRNDMGKSCAPGSIRVPRLFDLESFANVHHLVSTVTGTLAPNQSPLSLLRGCFPGGSITGAPKRRAMEIIDELERQPRSLYCGSVGYLGFNGRMDTNIAIRTLLAADGQLHCWGGGGIVADSVAEQEYRESLDKVALLMTTLEETFLRKSA